MQLPSARVAWRQEPARNAPAWLSLAIGMFDGVHLGHQAVIESAVARARQKYGLASVLTFDPHPSRLFRPDQPTQLLMPPVVKTRSILALGVDLLIWKTFDREFAKLGADAFVPFLKDALPALKSIHVGENFRFGQGRRGDIGALVSSAAKVGVDVFSVDRIRFNGEPVSSSRLREALQAGEIEAVNRMLGYDYYAEAAVVEGRKLGRTIGFPTLNMVWDPELRPRLGVYAVSVSDKTGKRAVGVANYGMRPTVEAAAVEPRLEVHVLGETRWGAGEYLKVEWLRFLRPERRFDSIKALQDQIRDDSELAGKLLSELS